MTARPCTRCRSPVLEPREPTKAERAWMKRLERVLKAAPEGIGLLTIGSSYLTVYDRARAVAHDIEHVEDGGVESHGLEIGTVYSAVSIEGVSG